MALTIVQSAVGDNGTGSTSVSATWPAATGSGNQLIAAVAVNPALSSVSAPSSVWNPSGNAVNAAGVQVWLFTVPQAPSQSGVATFSLSGLAKATCVIAEISNGMPRRPHRLSGCLIDNGGIDQAQGSSNTSGNATTPSPNQSYIAFGVHGTVNLRTFSGPTNGFTLVNQTQSTGGGGGTTKCSVALTFKECGRSTNYGNQLTLSSSSDWVSVTYATGITPANLQLTGVGL